MGEELAVVPKKWIFEVTGQKQCRWTSSLEKARQNAIPNPNWLVYTIKRIVAGPLDSYVTADCQLSDYKSCDSSTKPVEHDFPDTDPAKQDLPLSRTRKRPQNFDSDADEESCGEGTNGDEWPTGGSKKRVKKSQKSARETTALIPVSMPKPPNYAAVFQNVKGLPSQTHTSESIKDHYRHIEEDICEQFEEDNHGQLLDDHHGQMDLDHQSQLEEERQSKFIDARQSQRSSSPVTRRSPLLMTQGPPPPVTHRSLPPVIRRSPTPVTQRSPPLSLLTQRPPSPVTRRSPPPVTWRSPPPVIRCSPSLLTQHSPPLVTQRPPSPVTRRSPPPVTWRSPPPVTWRSPSQLTQCSSSLMTQYSSPLATQATPRSNSSGDGRKWYEPWRREAYFS